MGVADAVLLGTYYILGLLVVCSLVRVEVGVLDCCTEGVKVVPSLGDTLCVEWKVTRG